MLVLLERKKVKSDHTYGSLKIVDENKWEIVCEVDTIEPKNVGLERDSGLAVPCGSYDLDITYSPRFRENLPLISSSDVPRERGIRIHAGNHSDDTEGCVLVGDYDPSTGTLKNSRQAVKRVREALSRTSTTAPKLLILHSRV